MKARELKKKYIEFFQSKNHKLVPSASLIPEHDPTVLFTTAGMHPLVPFLMGQKHPQGKRLVNVQKCIRTDDIDDVGDETHLTFFEMLGNWSLGDYWKKEAIEWSFEFLTRILKFDKKDIYITCFRGDKDAPRDTESAKVWESLGIPQEKIFYLGKKDNWWGPPGKTGPCGPDTEMFIDTGNPKCGRDCKPGCNCGKYFEIWNDVFTQYNKTASGKYEKLKQQNVDTGMGVERTIALLQGKKNVFETELFLPVVKKIKGLARVTNEKSVRIIADHIKAATFTLSEKIYPSNLDQGYILRRFIRRSIRHGKLLGIEKEFLTQLAEAVIDIYKDDYKELKENKEFIIAELKKEEEKFNKTIEKGLRQFEKISQGKKIISAEDAFFLFQSLGFPIEMTEELAKEKGKKVDADGFQREFKKHQELSRKGAEKRFKGGLADSSVETTKLHTATHLLNEAIRRVLKRKDIVQKGSNITPERLRFDFNFDRKLTDKELKEIEDLINKIINQAIPVKKQEMSLAEAKKKNAQGVFEYKYGEKVNVYIINNFSIEICGGPHVKNTKELGEFKIIKEEGVAAGIRRIKGKLE